MANLPSLESCLPRNKSLFYNGRWQTPSGGQWKETLNPGNGRVVERILQASADDVDAAVQGAHRAFSDWKIVSPAQRASHLRKAAHVLRQHAKELAVLDALNTGNPVAEMLNDANVAAANLDYFAGLVPMIKGETIPISDDSLHYTLREPLGVVARIVAFNHPVMFAGAKLAAPLAAGNTVIIKPPDQAPLSCLRLAELLGDVFPPGVFNVLPGSVECGKALSNHPLVKKVTLIGSVSTGKAIQRAAADSLKPTLLELGGKNALIAFPDANVEKLVEGVAKGMNFTWAGQSCGSTSRVFLHENLHDEVLEKVKLYVENRFKPGIPTEMSTTMGPVISKEAYERVLGYIESAKQEGATLVTGGKPPSGSADIEAGFFIEPTIFANVQPTMRIAKEEIFGPIMSVFRWNDEEELLKMVNSTQYGLTASVYSENLATAHSVVKKVEAGYVWVNQVGKHFLNVPFGGVKESGLGREECLDELLAFTQTKSVNVSLSK
ncbi:MAG: hypothetical protein M1821_005888 [Bathelium mastoideum]|nr:MAG: hypothetical protein M1821_005888 [Bathelium mastoideum]KAI9688576.1 MAG: hypothetical protein M1822_001525 [Bathelium mastoideum]